jgi:hypothetical protein
MAIEFKDPRRAGRSLTFEETQAVRGYATEAMHAFIVRGYNGEDATKMAWETAWRMYEYDRKAQEGNF